MRELTNNEMSNVMKAAQQALPNDIKDTHMIIIFHNLTPKGDWINRISNVRKDLANEIISVWAKWIKNRDKFGDVNSN